MFTVSWVYLYVVGGVLYAGGSFFMLRAGVLDMKIPAERKLFILTTGALVLFAAVHALFQFVMPFVGTGG